MYWTVNLSRFSTLQWREAGAARWILSEARRKKGERMKSIPFRVAALTPIVLFACTLSLLSEPGPSRVPTSLPTSPASPVASATLFPTATATLVIVPSAPLPISPGSVCEDPQALETIRKLETAVRTSDGTLLASLVSPPHGMDARLFRDGRVVNYDREHAAALFESRFSLNWGNAPGSGLETRGSFNELIVPDLLDVFSREYEVTCNQLKVGGTTYEATWPYPGIEYLAVHFPGTDAYAGLDWHTWVLGFHYVDGHPFLYAMMQFKWEP